jgi:hypothetical protein
MPTILFVHGTGVRAKGYEKTLASIRQRVEVEPALKHFQLGRCLWGETHGSRLIEGGRTIPGYYQGYNQAVQSEEERKILLKWWLLCQDPGYQIDQLWRVRTQNLPPQARHTWQEKLKSIAAYQPSEKTLQLLAESQVADLWPEAFTAVTSREQWKEAAPSKEKNSNNFYPEFVRCTAEALVAELMLAGFSAGIPAMSGEVRDKLVEAVINDLEAKVLGVFDWMKSLVGEALLKAFAAGDYLISGISPRPVVRNWVSSNSLEKLGDILYYQAHGQRIRDFIGRRIEEAEPPVIVLAHSLGGIASVELLIQQDLRHRVEALITVGSQSPLFYEMNCLTTLERTLESPTPPLPEHFPAWLNLYDPNDYLSYAAEPVFGAPRVVDRQILSRQPRLMAHSAYWNQPEVWHLIAEFVGKHPKPSGV